MRKILIVTAILLFAGIAYGQTLSKGNVVSIHAWTVKLNPDVSMNQFLTMWENEFKPIFTKTIPEMKPYVIKGINDQNKYNYAGLYIWDSIDKLLEYFNADGSPTEKGAAAAGTLMEFMSVLEKYGEFTYTSDDYVIIQ